MQRFDGDIAAGAERSPPELGLRRKGAGTASKLGSTPDPGEPLLLRPKEAAELLAMSPRKLWELTNRGEVPSVRIGRAVRYSLEDLRNLVRAWRRG